MTPTLKPFTKTIATIVLLFLFTACANSSSTEVAIELPTETQPDASSTITATAEPTATPTPAEILTATAMQTSEPTPTFTQMPNPTKTPTAQPTLQALLCPFTPEQLYGYIQFPISDGGESIYTVKVIQSASIPINENTIISGPFDYIHPSNIGVGWVLTHDGPQAIAFLNTFSLTPVQIDGETRTSYIYDRYIKPNSIHVMDAAQQHFMLEQFYHLNHYSATDPITGQKLYDYDDWEATDWNKTNPDINRPRNGFGDEWYLLVVLPDNPYLQELLTEVDNSLDANDEIGGRYSMQELIEYTLASPAGGFLFPVGVVAPMLDVLSNEEVEGIRNFLDGGDSSGLPKIEIDGLSLPFLPTYGNHWFTDLSAEYYTE